MTSSPSSSPRPDDVLAIPNTTTTPAYTGAGAAAFPSEAGASTPYTSGFLFVANAAAFVSLLKGRGQGAVGWTPEALVSPTLVPLSTDLSARNPDYIFGVRARDGVSGTHAQVFGALFQQGEPSFVPSGQFGGTVSTSGSFSPAVTSGQEINYTEFTAPITLTQGVNTELAPLTVVDSGSLNYDGTAILIQFFAPRVTLGAGAGATVGFNLWDGTDLGRIAFANETAALGGALVFPGLYGSRRLTPAAGTHDYRIRGWASVANGSVNPGLGGAGVELPGYIRITRI